MGGGPTCAAPWEGVVSVGEPEGIRVRCTCGAKLRMPASAAGRRVKCPKCGAVFRVPSAASAGDGEAAGVGAHTTAGATDSMGKACPACGAPMTADAILCIECGYNLTTKKRIGGTDRPRPKLADQTQGGQPRTCPCCGKTYPGNSKICVACGIDLRTGRSVRIAQDVDVDRVYINAERIIRVLSWIIGFGIYPIASEAFGTRRPYVVRSITIVTIAASIWFWSAAISGSAEPEALLDLMLWSGRSDAPAVTAVEVGQDQDYVDQADAEDGYEDPAAEEDEFYDDESAFYGDEHLPAYHPRQLVSHAFLHAGLIHLAGNMLFLMILGSRVNAVIGNVGTLVVYPLFAAVGGLAHMHATADGPLHPMLGASGAVMGMAGMYLVFFPLDKVHMAIWQRWGLLTWFRLSMKLFAVRGFWVVLFYIAFDVVVVLLGWTSGVAHWAHLGGFLAGVAVALGLLGSRLISCKGGDLVTTVLGRWAWPLVGKPNRPPKGLPLP